MSGEPGVFFRPSDIGAWSYRITREPLEVISEATPGLDEALADQRQELFEMIHQRPWDAILRLQTLLEQFPDSPLLLNWLTSAYGTAGKLAEAEATARRNYERNPHYLFARLNHAQMCMTRGEVDQVPIILENKFDLRQLYPERDTFHVTEFISFSRLVAEYFLRVKRHREAESLANLMQQIDPDNVQTKLVLRAVEGSGLLRLAKRMSEFLLGQGRLPK